MEKRSIANLDIVTLRLSGLKKYFITANRLHNGREYDLFENLLQYVEAENAQIVSQLVFGGLKHHDAGATPPWPVTWLHGDGCSCGCLTSTQVVAVAGVETVPVMLDGRQAGFCYEDADARYCHLGNIHTNDLSGSRAEHALRAYEKMRAALRSVDMNFSNVVRMWNYLDNLLEWYGDFNAMRTAFYERHGVFSHIVPASTGIGARNPSGAAHTGELLAVKPKHSGVRIAALPSPLQCPAPDYKSSFSRAVEMAFPGHRRIFVSGTASIDPAGNTVNADSVGDQIDLTMRVVGEILRANDMDWQNTARAIAYFADINDFPRLTQYLEANSCPALPLAVAHADICRDNLLFELELDATA